MKFGKIDHVLIMGGGMLITNFAIELIKNDFKVTIVTSKRQIDENEEFFQSLRENNLTYVISENISSETEILEQITITTLGISYGSPWILKKEFIDRFQGKILNIHGARLPRDRGGATFSWLPLQSKKLGYCLIHKLTEVIDSGEVIKVREFLYPPECRIPIQYKKHYEKQNKEFLNEFIREIKNEAEFNVINQPEHLSTYWPRISTEFNGLINWNWKLREIEQFICAFDEPYKGASTFINKKKVFLKSCMIDFDDGIFHPFQKGLIYKKSSNSIFIATEDGTLIINKIFNEKGDEIFDEIKIGDRMFTPNEHLEKASTFRPIYTTSGLKEKPL